MAYADLREFVRKLEKEGELRRIRAEVDPVLEITEVVQRGMRGKKSGQAGMPVPPGHNPALLFEKPKGSRFPLLINAFGSVRRMALALEVKELDEVAERIQGFLKMETPQGFFDKVKMLPKLAELGSFFPKSVKTGACKEVIEKGRFRWYSRGIRRRGSEMWGCTACRCTTSGRQECTGRRKSMGRSIFGERRRRIPKAESR